MDECLGFAANALNLERADNHREHKKHKEAERLSCLRLNTKVVRVFDRVTFFL
jgi:hypothetical protein